MAAIQHDGTMLPEAPQAHVRQMRDDVLGGRGPGASQSEFLAHTRARQAVGGEPVPVLRERVARQAASARGDVEGLAMQVAADRARLASDLDILLPRLHPRSLLVSARGARRRLMARRGVRATALVLAAVLVARRIRRRSDCRGTPASPLGRSR